MREQFKQWQPKIRINKWWVMGAIATPAFLGMVWWLGLLPNRRLQPDYSHLPHNETAALAHSDRETLIGGIGAITIVAGGIFLVLNSRTTNRHPETANLSGVDLSGADLSGANLNNAELNEANLSDANLSGVDLSGADLNYAGLNGANLNGANLSGANLVSANLSGANLSRADLRYANLSGTDLNCTLLTDANLSNANLSGALLFFTNSRDAQNLEPLQLEAKAAPFLCNVALPAYSSKPDVDPNRDCDRIPYLLSARYDISLEEAQEIVYEARQHRWD